MRGDLFCQDGMFSYGPLEQRKAADHPLRAVRRLTDAVLGTLSPEFDALYAASGRPSVAREYILRALFMQVFYSVRSERLLVEQIAYNLLFRWFVGLGMDDAVWNHVVFCQRPRSVVELGCGPAFLRRGEQAGEEVHVRRALNVDGTLIQAWASQKSFCSKDGSTMTTVRTFADKSAATIHISSTTDPDARLYKKSYGKESKLSYLGHALLENRNGLIAAAMVITPTATQSAMPRC